MIDVRDFGATGKGKNDDSSAFRQALAEAGGSGGETVSVPSGAYLLTKNLTIPKNVTLAGSLHSPTAFTGGGTMLLVTCGAGKPDGEPFLLLQENATLKGLAVFYPEQRCDAEPIPYPWTVRGIGDNCTLRDVLMVNPYQGVDFGTLPAGRHYLSGLYAGAIYRGLFIDQCYDVGRVENVHFWPFWEKYTTELKRFIEAEGVAFVLGRTDWEYLTNCFCIGYRVGFHFVRTASGSPNALLTQCGSDVGPVAVRVSSCMEHAGISFVNGQFMAGIEIEESNRGPVKFTACGFWPVETTDFHARISGSGHTTFNGCHFSSWAKRNPSAAAIDALSGGLTVTACDFMEPDRTQISLGGKVDAAIVYGNRFRGGRRIRNAMGRRALIDFNSKS